MQPTAGRQRVKLAPACAGIRPGDGIELARKKATGDPTLRIVLPDATKPSASL